MVARVPTGALAISGLEKKDKKKPWHFGLSKSFDLGELLGVSQQKCFVLGYELADIDALVVERAVIKRKSLRDQGPRRGASMLCSTHWRRRYIC